MTYENVTRTLREHYDRTAHERDKDEKSDWKLEQRKHFLELLNKEGKCTLLEIGAGTGHDSLFFKENGLDVTSTDLSPVMVELCRTKGLTAFVMDLLHLELPAESFDAVYALNCLLHVPRAEMPRVLETLRNILRPSGLLFVGTYGGQDKEGFFVEGGYEDERFLSYYSQSSLQKEFGAYFEIVTYREIPISEGNRSCVQSLIVRKTGLNTGSKST